MPRTLYSPGFHFSSGTLPSRETGAVNFSPGFSRKVYGSASGGLSHRPVLAVDSFGLHPWGGAQRWVFPNSLARKPLIDCIAGLRTHALPHKLSTVACPKPPC